MADSRSRTDMTTMAGREMDKSYNKKFVWRWLITWRYQTERGLMLYPNHITNLRASVLKNKSPTSILFIAMCFFRQRERNELVESSALPHTHQHFAMGRQPSLPKDNNRGYGGHLGIKCISIQFRLMLKASQLPLPFTPRLRNLLHTLTLFETSE